MRSWKRRKKEKLYQQWGQYSGLPPEAIPQREEGKDERIVRAEKDRLRPYKEKLLAMIQKLLKVERQQ